MTYRLLSKFSFRSGCSAGLRRWLCGGVVVGLGLCRLAAASAAQLMPFADGEILVYEITWPSGLGLGEAEFRAKAIPQGWEFEAEFGASLPTMDIRDSYWSKADASLCSLEFEKRIQRGARKGGESIVYDQEQRIAERKTLGGGGESEVQIAPCTKDGLAFLYALRQDLAGGRIPPPDDINFGSQYQISLTYAESREIEAAGKRQTADRILIDLTGPASSHSFEIFFAQDPARTPLLMRVPLELGTFSLKLTK